MNTAIEKLAAFGLWCLKEHREHGCADLDGSDLEDQAIKIGLLKYVARDRPCSVVPEVCRCRAYYAIDEWPVECLVMDEEVHQFLYGGSNYEWGQS